MQNKSEIAAARLPPWVYVPVAALLGAGVLIRLLPLFDVKGHLYWFFMTEDGYLLQTVARNIAVGLGMSTADGTMATNGVQPLATFVYAALHALAVGSKLLAIAYVTALSAVTAVLAAWLLRRLARSVLREAGDTAGISVLTAGFWFASPLVISHSMNGLETGIYYLAILASLTYYFALDLDAPKGVKHSQSLIFGIALGITFLARNDAIFFIAAILLSHMMMGGASTGGGWRRRALDCLIAGATSVLIASPWLIYNRIRFGSIVPISGLAESHGARIGDNLANIPANLLEALTLYVPVPRNLETAWPVICAALLVVLLSAVLSWLIVGRLGLRGRRFFVLTWVFCLALGAYYGLFFGAQHFLSRYLSALTPLFALLTIASAYLLLAQSPRRAVLPAASALVAILLLLITSARAVLHYREAANNGHRQVVEWVNSNVDQRQWVGAIQTGTLGYFHDRTINLDGKVNPAALREIARSGDIRPYVLHRTPINYVADWASIAGWVESSQSEADREFQRGFQLVLADKAANLGVLRRTHPLQDQ